MTRISSTDLQARHTRRVRWCTATLVVLFLLVPVLLSGVVAFTGDSGYSLLPLIISLVVGTLLTLLLLVPIAVGHGIARRPDGGVRPRATAWMPLYTALVGTACYGAVAVGSLLEGSPLRVAGAVVIGAVAWLPLLLDRHASGPA